MAFPTVTMSGDNASSKEVWKLFWYASLFLNGNIDTTEVSFGSGPVSGALSRNLDPTKVRFSSLPWIGHDHLPASRISMDGIRRKHFDAFSLPVLWASLRSEDLSGSGAEKVCLTTQRTAVTTNGSGVGTADVYGSPFNANTDVYLYRDTSRWVAGNFSPILATLVTYVANISDLTSSFTWYPDFQVGAIDSTFFRLTISGGGVTKTGYFDSICVVRYNG